MGRLLFAGMVFVVGGWFATAGSEPEPEAPSHARVTVETGSLVANTDERYLSFAIDTAQVVGGRFWAAEGTGEGLLHTKPVPPFDFRNPHLRRMAAALAPAYLRIGGTDADRTVYAVGEQRSVPAKAEWVLDRRRWDEVNAFARELGLRIVFTLNAGPSARAEDGTWDDRNARGLVEYTVSRGYPVDVWELGNEVNAFPLLHRMWLTPSRYADDLRKARRLVDELDPRARLAAPASAYWPVVGEARSFLPEVLAAAGSVVDLVTWHYYPQQSFRCPVATRRAEPGRALRPRELAEIDHWAGEVMKARDQHARKASVWLGETGGAQCGGEPNVSDAFADALWWLDQLGRMAGRNPVVIRQTLVGSDYGLLASGSLEPRPSYHASWLWKRLMGRGVLAVDGHSRESSLALYAHCTPGAQPGAVTLLAINHHSRSSIPVEVEVGRGRQAQLFMGTADGPSAKTLRVNELDVAVSHDGALPSLEALARPVSLDRALTLPPLSFAFVVVPEANAAACMREGAGGA